MGQESNDEERTTLMPFKSLGHTNAFEDSPQLGEKTLAPPLAPLPSGTACQLLSSLHFRHHLPFPTGAFPRAVSST